MLLLAMAFGSCQQDLSINTTSIAGNWFVNKSELIDATSINDELFTSVNTKNFDVYNLKAGNMILKISETQKLNDYFVILYTYDGSKWVNTRQEQVHLSAQNKFSFYGNPAKISNLNSTKLTIKVQIANEFFRHTLERTTINPS